MTPSKQRILFTSKSGFILSAAGSAIGLGNICKFPGKAYDCGGGAFLLIYVLMVTLLGTSVMLAEFVIGRRTHKNIVGAIRQLGRRWAWLGWLGILTGCLILSYYCQIGGWTMKYIIAYIVEADVIFTDPSAYFLQTLGAEQFPLQGAVIYPLLFLLSAAFIINRGVVEGIEKLSKLLMPLFLVLLVVLMVRTCTLPNAGEGLRCLLTVDVSTVNGSVVLTALGQAFFSLSLGMGIMLTYASYLHKEENLVANTAVICTLDTLIALVAGFTIVPAAFATGITPGMDSAFSFTSLAGVFMAIPGGVVFGILFYFLLFFAAITSAISILESTVAFLTEEKHLPRRTSLILICTVLFFVGMCYTLSLVHTDWKGIWWSIAEGIQYPSFGLFLEYLTDRLLLPLCAFFLTFFVGWIWGAEEAVKEATSYGKYRFPLASLWVLLVKFAAPVAIATITIAGVILGLPVN